MNDATIINKLLELSDRVHAKSFEIEVAINALADTVQKERSDPKIVYCSECIHDGLISCPIVQVERQGLCMIRHDPEWYCADGERDKRLDEAAEDES